MLYPNVREMRIAQADIVFELSKEGAALKSYVSERPAVIPRPTHSVHLALAQPPMKTKSTLEPTMRSGTHLARPWRAYRAMGKRSCLVWWPRIWPRNTVEPMRTSGTGRDSVDG
jgi:hypothetical protein